MHSTIRPLQGAWPRVCACAAACGGRLILGGVELFGSRLGLWRMSKDSGEGWCACRCMWWVSRLGRLFLIRWGLGRMSMDVGEVKGELRFAQHMIERMLDSGRIRHCNL